MFRRLRYIVGLGALMGGLAVPSVATAAPGPACFGLPVCVTVGTGGVATLAASAASEAFSFQGRIEFPDGAAFEGTASGTSALITYQHNNLIPSFTLQGANLTGTCSGQWLVGPNQSPPLPVAEPVSGSPVVEGSLDCALSYAGGFSYQTGLTIALVRLGADPNGHYMGAFGPGLWQFSAGPLAVGNSIGAADLAYGTYDLLGHLDIGFGWEGEATGSQFGQGAPFQLSGTDGNGFRLSAQCRDDTPYLPDPIPSLLPFGGATPVVRLLTCTGTAGYGPPPNTIQLLLVLPVPQASNPYCSDCVTENTGVFVGT